MSNTTLNNYDKLSTTTSIVELWRRNYEVNHSLTQTTIATLSVATYDLITGGQIMAVSIAAGAAPFIAFTALGHPELGLYAGTVTAVVVKDSIDNAVKTWELRDNFNNSIMWLTSNNESIKTSDELLYNLRNNIINEATVVNHKIISFGKEIIKPIDLSNEKEEINFIHKKEDINYPFTTSNVCILNSDGTYTPINLNQTNNTYQFYPFPSGGGSTPLYKLDPLIIDLDGNGFNLTNEETGAYFDLDKNGFAESTGWVSGNDIVLAMDRDNNGFIDNGGELFGDQTVLKNGQIAINGVQALAELDINLGGKPNNIIYIHSYKKTA